MDTNTCAEIRALPSLSVAAVSASRFSTSLALMVYPGTIGFLIPAWQMTAAQAGSIQTAFNVCYSISLVATSWLSDRVGAKRVYLWSCWMSAAAGLVLALFARSYWNGLGLFALMGLFQGGTYGPSIIVVTEGVPVARRDAAIGWVLAAASLGYFASIAAAHTLAGLSGYRTAFVICAAGPLAGLALAIYALRNHRRRTPADPPAPPKAPRGGFNRRSVLLSVGYMAHCWELLGMWAWLPAFLAASLAASGGPRAFGSGIWIAAAIHLSGFAASAVSGHASERMGHRRVLISVGLCGAFGSFAMGWLTDASVTLLLAAAAFYGFMAIGDSPVLSAAIAKSVATRHLGRALAVRSVLGFGIGGLAPVAFGAVLDGFEPGTGWILGFSLLGVGGLGAALCAAFLESDEDRRIR